MSQSQPGWHPQPDGRERYWDGTQWTDQFRPPQAGTMPPPPPAGASPMSHREAKKLAKSTRPWWKKKRIMIPLLVLLLALLATQCGGGDNKSANSSAPSSGTSSESGDKPVAVASLGQTVKEGEIEFTIKSWKCGAKSVGPEGVAQKAQGQFCIADVVYKNVGKEPKTFDANMAMTARQGDMKYKPNSMANIAANTDDQTFLEQVNPGNSAKGQVVFDVPANAKIDTVYVVDGFTGDGTPIKVG